MRKQHKLKLYFHFLFAIMFIAKICVANEDFTPTISKVGGGEIIKKGEAATFTVSEDNAVYAWTFPANGDITKTITYEHTIAEKKTLTCNVTKDGVTKQATKDFYWYDGNDIGETKSVDCTVKIDGDTTEYNLEATFKVKKPDYTMSTQEGVTELDKGIMNVILRYGDGTEDNAGMRITRQGGGNPGTKMQWIQIATIEAFRGGFRGFPDDDLPGNCGFDGKTYAVKFTDTPSNTGSIWYHNELWMKIKCDTWMMFKPDGDDNIPVPCAKVYWDWQAKAICNSMYQWVFDQAFLRQHTDPPIQQTFEFPKWTRKVSTL